jgi:hypothetical protein
MKMMKSRKNLMRRILLTAIICSFLSTGFQTLLDKNIPVVIVSGQENIWVFRIQISETSGKGACLVLKGSPNASDGQDDLDIPIPPAPMPPYIRAWFTTPFSVPFNNLMNESLQFPSKRAVWNFSVIWVPEFDNESLTTINITWDTSQASQSTFDSLQLYHHNTSVANMITENHYSFPSDGSIEHFQIIGQTMNKTTEQNTLPILPITLGIIILVIMILVALFFYRRKR